MEVALPLLDLRDPVERKNLSIAELGHQHERQSPGVWLLSLINLCDIGNIFDCPSYGGGVDWPWGREGARGEH